MWSRNCGFFQLRGAWDAEKNVNYCLFEFLAWRFFWSVMLVIFIFLLQCVCSYFVLVGRWNGLAATATLFVLYQIFSCNLTTLFDCSATMNGIFYVGRGTNQKNRKGIDNCQLPMQNQDSFIMRATQTIDSMQISNEQTLPINYPAAVHTWVSAAKPESLPFQVA